MEYLRTQVDSAFPGAVVAVGNHDHVALLAAVGHYGVDDPRPMTTETVFDLASLTKVIGLTTACILLVDQKKLDLNAPVQRYLPEFGGTGKERVTIRHLLTHSSGLPAWRPLFRESRLRRAVNLAIDRAALGKAYGDAPADQIVPPAVPVERIPPVATVKTCPAATATLALESM